MKSWAKKICGLLSLVLLAASPSFAASDGVAEHDNSRISIFLQPAISFLSFEEREYFQDAIDTIYQEFRANALTEEESLSVAKQNFQKVNFCFPITGGLQFQVRQDHFLIAGIGFIYDDESVVLTLSDGGLFSVALRWYWTLPGTEIYSSWGKIDADNSLLGAGFGFSVGYLIASWKGLNVFGDIGFSSIKVKSKGSFADIVPEGSTEKAKWDIGGLQLQIRVSFGVWNKPKPREEDDDDDIPDTDAVPDTVKADTAKVDTAKVDSVKADSVKADSVKVDAAKTDSVKTDSTIADTAIQESSAQDSKESKSPAPEKEQPVKEAVGSKKPEE